MAANESQKVSLAAAYFEVISRGVFINIACPRQLKTLTWVDWTQPALDEVDIVYL